MCSCVCFGRWCLWCFHEVGALWLRCRFVLRGGGVALKHPRLYPVYVVDSDRRNPMMSAGWYQSSPDHKGLLSWNQNHHEFPGPTLSLSRGLAKVRSVSDNMLHRTPSDPQHKTPSLQTLVEDPTWKNNTSKQHDILITRGWMKTLAIHV